MRLALTLLLCALPCFAGSWQAALRTAAITPRVTRGKPVYMAGFGQNRTALSVHDELYARVLVIRRGHRTVALIALDLIGLFKDEADRVRERLRRELGIEDALVCATHTHSGPDTLGIWGASRAASGIDAAYMQLVSDRTLSAARDAVSALETVEIVAASGRTSKLTRDMRLPIVIDEEMGVLQGRRNGVPRWTLVQWASHPEGLGRKNRQISADWCSYLTARIERTTGAPVAYFNGAIGGLMTCLEVPVTDPDTGKPAPLETFRHVELIGNAAADSALALARQARPIEGDLLDVKRREVDVPMTNTLYRAAVTLGVLKRQLYRDGLPTMAMMAAVARPDIRTEIALWRIGDVRIAAIPGELYPELALGRFQEPMEKNADYPLAPREPAVRPAMTGPHRWIFGLANDEIGYIIPKSQWDLNAPFCYGRAKPQYGEVNSVGAEAAPLLMQAFAELAGSN